MRVIDSVPMREMGEVDDFPGDKKILGFDPLAMYL